MLLQPVGQKRHTNVAIVSYRKKDEKSGEMFQFEIACYKNKVADFLAGAEKNDSLEEVLQSDKIFVSVGKGDLATVKSLKKCFGTTDTTHICKEILRHGETRATEKEREHELEYLQQEVLNSVTAMIMERTTALPIPPNQVHTLLFDELKFRIKPCPAKKRPEEHSKILAKDAVKLIEADPTSNRKIARIPTKLRLHIAADKLPQTGDIYHVEKETATTTVLVCHPRLFKELRDLLPEVAIDLVDSKVFFPLPALEAAVTVKETAVAAPVVAAATGTGGQSLECKSCIEARFGNVGELRGHYKSSWHEHNQKRQVKNLPPLAHLEFELLPESVKRNFLAVD